MYMPLLVDLRDVVVFAGERDEGLQKTEKMAVFADELLIVPEQTVTASHLHLDSGPLNRVPESLSLEEPREVPVHPRPAHEVDVRELVRGRSFVTSDLEDEELNREIAEACNELNVLCNVIDVKELCNTWLCSVIDVPYMQAGLSTKGGCAFYAQRTRMELEEEFRDRSEISRVFTELREGLREEQCSLCALDVVYGDDRMQELLEDQRWDEALERGRSLARDVPDGRHVFDHSIPDPNPLADG